MVLLGRFDGPDVFLPLLLNTFDSSVRINVSGRKAEKLVLHSVVRDINSRDGVRAVHMWTQP